EQYFTLMYGVLDVKTRELRYVRAGHPGPVHLRNSSDAIDLSGRSFPIGWVPEAAFEERLLALAPGDRLVLYSDGISEARNAAQDQFGQQRIIEAAQQTRSAALPD